MRSPVFKVFKLFFCVFVASVYGNASLNQPIVEFYDFDNLQYVFFSQRVTWDEAEILCTTSNARLAVLDNAEKAIAVAKAMSESNIVMEDAWLGGRRSNLNWIWVEGNNMTSNKYSSKIPSRSSLGDFPPWSREPSRPSKECLAIDRRWHSHPNFVDLDCRLLKPYICEKKSNDSLSTPVPSKWVQVQRSTYVLYHGRITWLEAVTFCRSKGARLAVIKNQNVIDILTNSMTKSRPDFESVWIGARFSYGQWTWLSTGSTLNQLTDETGYPPWRFGKSEKNYGCLLLDRHLENSSNFIELACDRKRDFVCEEYPAEELEEWMNEPTKFSYENSTFIIYPFDKTWDESRLYCYNRGSVLAHIPNIQLANLMVTAMGDHPREISHLWLGGLYHSNKSEWKWIHNNEMIPLHAEIDNSTFPPWARSITEVDSYNEESLCLNLDRSDHTTPHFYGLECESKQPFACIISCEEPPTVRNGSWTCNDQSSVKSCSLECKPGFFTMGLINAYCEIHSGWYNKPNWLEFPLCLDEHNYLKRMIRSLSQDLQKSSSYYLFLSHYNNEVQRFSLEFTKKMLEIFPLSDHLKMGMTNLNVNLRNNNINNQNDSCEAMELILSMKTGIDDNLDNQIDMNNHRDWYQKILRNSRDRIVIVAIIDSTTAIQNQLIFDQLRSKGHYVFTIGLKEDWEALLPLTTIGFDQRLNLYLFNEEELEAINVGLKTIKHRPLECVRTESKSTNSIDLIKPETTSIEALTNEEIEILSTSITDVETESQSTVSIDLIATEMTSMEAVTPEKIEVQPTSLIEEINTSRIQADFPTTESNVNFQPSTTTTSMTFTEEEKNLETPAESEKNPTKDDDFHSRIYMNKNKKKHEK